MNTAEALSLLSARLGTNSFEQCSVGCQWLILACMNFSLHWGGTDERGECNCCFSGWAAMVCNGLQQSNLRVCCSGKLLCLLCWHPYTPTCTAAAATTGKGSELYCPMYLVTACCCCCWRCCCRPYCPSVGSTKASRNAASLTQQ
jgi:hypothetical protein